MAFLYLHVHARLHDICMYVREHGLPTCHSNARAWRRALHNGWEWALILEDDAHFEGAADARAEKAGSGVRRRGEEGSTNGEGDGSCGGSTAGDMEEGKGDGTGGGESCDAALHIFLARLPTLLEAATEYMPDWQVWCARCLCAARGAHCAAHGAHCRSLLSPGLLSPGLLSSLPLALAIRRFWCSRR